MKINYLKKFHDFYILIFIFAICYLLFALIPVFAASEISGVISTGIGDSSGITGVIITAPTADPAPGTYKKPQNVSLILPAGAIDARYTLDGTDPVCPSTGTSYVTSAIIGASATIKAVSCYPNDFSSKIASFVYVIDAGGGGGGGGGGGATYVVPVPVTISAPLSTTTQQVDANSDNKIDILDFNVVMVNWGSSGGSIQGGDLNKDRKVDILDFNLLMVYWIQ